VPIRHWFSGFSPLAMYSISWRLLVIGARASGVSGEGTLKMKSFVASKAI
jgi:hypothetical protein